MTNQAGFLFMKEGNIFNINTYNITIKSYHDVFFEKKTPNILNIFLLYLY